MSSSSSSASATSKLTTASTASASSMLTTISASASSMLTTTSASASSMLTTTSASASCMLTAATPTLKRTVSNTSLDSALSQDPGHPTVHKRIHLDELSDEASSSSDDDSGDSDHESDDEHQQEEEEEDPVWAMMAPNVWDALSGAYRNKTIAWKKEMGDIVEVFGADSEIMIKLQGLATGASIELVDGKVLEISGPAQKVDHLVNVMQRLLVVFGPATKNYVTITVGGTQLSSHLDALKQTVGSNGRVVAAEKIHFSVCKTDGTWSASQVADLAKDVAAILASAPPSIHNAFICDNVAFFNPSSHQIQVLAVCPSDETSPIHEFIAMLQDALQQQGGLIMETTTHATIINRRKGSPSLATILAPLFSSSHDWLGPLTIQKVVVSRMVTSLHSKTQQYFNLWEVDV